MVRTMRREYWRRVLTSMVKDPALAVSMLTVKPLAWLLARATACIDQRDEALIEQAYQAAAAKRYKQRCEDAGCDEMVGIARLKRLRPLWPAKGS